MNPLQRWLAVSLTAWRRRDTRESPRADEAAFLPPLAALRETPAHPAPRLALWALMAFVLLALAWAAWCEVDVVTVAPGRLVVIDGTKTVQPLETATVRRIRVQDGDHVKAGQVLIELDPTTAEADSSAISAQADAARAELTRSALLLAALAGPLRAPAPTLSGADSLAQAEWADVHARLAQFDAEQVRRLSELATLRESSTKFKALLPLVRQREADLVALADQGFVSAHASQDRLRERLEIERDLATQQAREAEARAALQEGAQARAAYLTDLRRSLNERRHRASLDLAQQQSLAAKASYRESLALLRAPVAGTVQQLSVRTPGGVVTPAQTLLVVVPEEAALSAEVLVPNSEIGFIQVGQRAEIKLDTFHFTRYGTLPAEVVQINGDAVKDDNRGLVFTARLNVQAAPAGFAGRRLTLKPGMTLNAEILTDRRSVLGFVTSPIHQALAESARER